MVAVGCMLGKSEIVHKGRKEGLFPLNSCVIFSEAVDFCRLPAPHASFPTVYKAASIKEKGCHQF